MVFYLRKLSPRPEEMAQKLRALITLAEDWYLVPSLRDFDTLFWPVSALPAHNTHMYVHAKHS